MGPEVAREIKAYLTKNTFTSWDNLSSGWKNGADESTPGGIFTFHREKKMSDTHKLVWKGKHTNPVKDGMPFNVEDTLEFEFV